jgi:hypothetical protein
MRRLQRLYLLIFSPCLLISYGFSDDYNLLLNALLPNTGSIWKVALNDGRILYGPLAELSLQLAGSIENLRFVRAAGIAAIGCLVCWYSLCCNTTCTGPACSPA